MFSAKVVFFLSALAVCYGAPNAKLANKRLKVIGGDDAKIEDYPFVASVQHCILDCNHICGGIIIDDKWILTAPGCVEDTHIYDILKVAVGTVDVRKDDRIMVEVKDMYIHPLHHSDEIGPNDIALLKLSESLTFSDKVQPAKLPERNQEFNGSAIVIGYGERDYLHADNLHAALDGVLISNDDCLTAVKKITTEEDIPLDKDSNLCTLGKIANVCSDDIGGPLYQDGIVIGAVSWYIDPCGITEAPNIYTKLSNFVDWINQTITENS